MPAPSTARAPLTAVLYGPSLFGPGPLAIIDVGPRQTPIDEGRLRDSMRAFGLEADPPAPGGSVDFARTVLTCAVWLERRARGASPPRFSFRSRTMRARSVVLASGPRPDLACRVLLAAVGLATRLWEHARDPTRMPVVDPGFLKALIDRASQDAGLTAQDLIFVSLARERNIPVVAIPDVPSLLLFGQGRHGRLMRSGANDRDSAIGTAIAVNKAWTNAVIARLGYPSVRHVLVRDENQAIAAAGVIGFPLVVKPVASGMGKGVCADVRTLDECRRAYHAAAKHALRGVLIEGHVPGDDHRLAVFGGRLAWVVLRRPASVTGDGSRSIEALIADENARRNALPASEKGGRYPIKVDAELRHHLQKQGLELESVVADGQLVRLGSVANVARGGTYEDVTQRVHPDNVAMAEGIASALRMDAIGIDFLTPDITRSWREVPSAVIEVNETPGAGTAHYCGRVLDRLFTEGIETRVEFILLANLSARALPDDVLARSRRRGGAVGFLSASRTLIDGHAIGHDGQSLNARMLSLLLDSRIGTIVASLGLDDLIREGILLDRVDHAVIGPGLPPQIQALIRAHARVVEMVGE